MKVKDFKKILKDRKARWGIDSSFNDDDDLTPGEWFSCI